MSPSRMDRLIKALGGEDNLPPKLAQAAAIVPQQQSDNPTNQGIQPIEDLLDEHSQSQGTTDWWNVTPELPQPVSQTQAQTTSLVTPLAGSMSYYFDPRKDEPAPLGLNFCPFIAVTKLPYKFVKKEFMQGIATAFFDEGKIWGREWDV